MFPYFTAHFPRQNFEDAFKLFPWRFPYWERRPPKGDGRPPWSHLSAFLRRTCGCSHPSMTAPSGSSCIGREFRLQFRGPFAMIPICVQGNPWTVISTTVSGPVRVFASAR